MVARIIEQVEGTLAEVRKIDSRAKFREQAEATTLDELIELGRSRGYKNARFWAERVWGARSSRRAA